MAPAVIPTGVVLGVGLAMVVAQSVGLVPVVGPARLSVDAYRDAADGENLATSLLLSLALAGAATGIAVVVGLAAAIAVRATRVGGRLLAALAALTIPVPHLIGAAAIGLLLSDSGLVARLTGAAPGEFPQLVGGPWWTAVVLEFGWKESAFVALVVVSALTRYADGLGETAAVLGAGAWKRLRHITIPLATPALVVAGGVSFVYVLGSYEVSWLLGRAYPEPLPVLAYRLFTSSDLSARPEALAVATLTVAACALVGVGVVRMLSRSLEPA
jgi:putative spermidine/putrescine transport system permease protein